MRAGHERRRTALLAAALCLGSFVVGAGVVRAVQPDSQRQPETLSLHGSVPSVGAAERQHEVAGILAEQYYRPVDAAQLDRTPVANLAKLLD
ncbi:MAG: hypothetical protein QOF35_2019, partial [Actinomycetota bacterium]|nr:hypothetical protein [Actinomycetota bacterium]